MTPFIFIHEMLTEIANHSTAYGTSQGDGGVKYYILKYSSTQVLKYMAKIVERLMIDSGLGRDGRRGLTD